MSAGIIRLIILISVVSAVLLIGMVIFGFWMFDFALVRKPQMDFDAGDDLLPHMDVIRFRSREAQNKIMNMKHEDVYIKSYDDLLLHATFVQSPFFSRKVVIAVHGYNSFGMFDMSSVVPFFRGMGYNVIIVDDRAHGKSEGKYIGFGWLDRLDVMNWCRYAALWRELRDTSPRGFDGRGDSPYDVRRKLSAGAGKGSDCGLSVCRSV